VATVVPTFSVPDAALPIILPSHCPVFSPIPFWGDAWSFLVAFFQLSQIRWIDTETRQKSSKGVEVTLHDRRDVGLGESVAASGNISHVAVYLGVKNLIYPLLRDWMDPRGSFPSIGRLGFQF